MTFRRFLQPREGYEGDGKKHSSVKLVPRRPMEVQQNSKADVHSRSKVYEQKPTTDHEQFFADKTHLPHKTEVSVHAPNSRLVLNAGRTAH